MSIGSLLASRDKKKRERSLPELPPKVMDAVECNPSRWDYGQWGLVHGRKVPFPGWSHPITNASLVWLAREIRQAIKTAHRSIVIPLVIEQRKKV